MFKNFKLLGSCLGVVAMMSAALPADATLTSSAEITGIGVADGYSVAVGWIKLNKHTTGRPSCTGRTDEYAFDISSNSGKALFAVAQAAFLAGKQIIVFGTDSCNISGFPTESVKQIYVLRTQVP